jgi:YHS domain-containing protein
MNQVKDPVCGRMIDPDSAQAGTIYESQEIYFCSNRCRRGFEAEPARFRDNIERHEPPYTVKGVAAPKFGSAGSGGLEYEPGPERHEGE